MESAWKGIVDASKKATNVPVCAVATAAARPMKWMVNEFYMLCVRLFLLMTKLTIVHLLLLVGVPIVTFGDGNGLIFAPRCNGECFTSRKEKKCDHPVNKVSLDNVGEYVVFPSRWYHHGYYNIKSDKEFYTAQLFAMGSSKPEAWQNITRKVTGTWFKVMLLNQS